MNTECPNCGSLWGFEEMDWQECDCCGYPNVDEDFMNDDDDLDDYEDEYDDEYIQDDIGNWPEEA
jgi:hypothetical protein